MLIPTKPSKNTTRRSPAPLVWLDLALTGGLQEKHLRFAERNEPNIMTNEINTGIELDVALRSMSPSSSY